ncbi:hypothetical protein BH10PLA2_BH10PLA2_28140 [soil metagenome]
MRPVRSGRNPVSRGSAKMSKMRILIAAIAVVGLGQAVHAGDNPGGQLPPPSQSTQTYSAPGSDPRHLGILPSSSTGPSCGAGGCSTGTCGSAPCGTGCGSERGCLAKLCNFFTYRRLPYTDINTLCCGCSGTPRPPLYVYFLHPCADQAPPRELPDLSKCGSCKNGHCTSCGRGVAPGCSSCPSCGK